MKKMLVLVLLLAPVTARATVHGEYYDIRLTGREVCEGQKPRVVSRALTLHIPRAEGEIWVGEDQFFSEGWHLRGPRWMESGRYWFDVAGSALGGWLSLDNRRGNYIFTQNGCYEKGKWRIIYTFFAPE